MRATIGELVAAGSCDAIGFAGLNAKAGGLPAAIGGEGNGGTGGRQIDGGFSENGGAGDVVAVVAFAFKDLPVFDDGGPVFLDALVEAFGEFERVVAGVGFQVAKGGLGERVLVEKGGGGPAPAVGFDVEVRLDVVARDLH